MSPPSTAPRRQTASRPSTPPYTLVKHLRASGFSVIDTTTHDRLGTVGGGRQPHAMVVHPAGRWAYVPYMATGTVEVLDLRGPSVVATITAGTGPVGAALSRGGSFLIVGTYGPLPERSTPGLQLFKTNPTTGELVPTSQFTLGTCAGMTRTSGNNIWVALKDQQAVVRLAGPPFSVREPIEVPAGPQGLTAMPEYGLIGVDCVGANTVALIDESAGEVVDTAPAPNPRGGPIVAGVDRWFVADTEGDGVTVVDIHPQKHAIDTHRISLGTPTAFIDAAPDGACLVVDAYEDDRIAVLDPVSLETLARPQVGGVPRHPQFAPDSRRCYVPAIETDTVTVLDLDGLPGGTISRIEEIAVPAGAAPSGCYFTDRRIT